VLDKVWILWYNSDYENSELVGIFRTEEEATKAKETLEITYGIADNASEYLMINPDVVLTFDEWNIHLRPTDG
jgi:hypothetical protein